MGIRLLLAAAVQVALAYPDMLACDRSIDVGAEIMRRTVQPSSHLPAFGGIACGAHHASSQMIQLNLSRSVLDNHFIVELQGAAWLRGGSCNGTRLTGEWVLPRSALTVRALSLGATVGVRVAHSDKSLQVRTTAWCRINPVAAVVSSPLSLPLQPATLPLPPPPQQLSLPLSLPSPPPTRETSPGRPPPLWAPLTRPPSSLVAAPASVLSPIAAYEPWDAPSLESVWYSRLRLGMVIVALVLLCAAARARLLSTSSKRLGRECRRADTWLEWCRCSRRSSRSAAADRAPIYGHSAADMSAEDLFEAERM